MSLGSSLYGYLKQTKVPFFSFYKLENMRAEQVLFEGISTSGRGRRYGEIIGGRIQYKYYINMYINEKIISIETMPRMGGG
jgi:hypothetical protein